MNKEQLKTFKTWWHLNLKQLKRLSGDSLLHLTAGKETSTWVEYNRDE